jgi:ankyrin repeat protein
VAAGADANYGNGDPLNAAASLGAVEVAIVLLDVGAKPELRGTGGETALHWAAYIGNDKLVARLIAAGAPVDVKDPQFNSTPLGWTLHAWRNYPPPANQSQHREVALRLSRAGARVEAEWRDAFDALVSGPTQ